VGLSGGADSLALTAAAVAEAEVVDALIVDHGLQAGSAAVAARAAATAESLGCRSARVLTVEVTGGGGLEAAARRARYAALDSARAGLPVLLGHTLDDQAETVLLGLGRGSGARSIQGMADFAGPWGRPLLGVRRATTRQLCADVGLTPHEDPHNSAPEFARVRLRTEVLPLLEQVLGGGVAQALARTAAQLRADAAVLDELAEQLLSAASDGPTLSVETLVTAPAALRRRAIRAWLLEGGAKALTDKHLRAVDALVTDWHGQGGVAVGGGKPGTRLVAVRDHGRLALAFAG
jgi:tRNA(Ile)-lysidine synthase